MTGTHTWYIKPPFKTIRLDYPDPYLRHHHMTMELCPTNEASPRGLHGIIPLQEAPPRGLRGITPWPWGTTTTPRGITSFSSRHHQGLPLRVHGITSNRWGATKISHYKSHGIMPYPYFKHVSPAINNFSKHTYHV